MRKCCFYPRNVPSNISVSKYQEVLIEAGYQLISLKEFLTSFKNIKECDCFVFNWFEDSHTSSKLLNSIEIAIKKCFIRHLSKYNRRIVYVMHNKIPHDVLNKQKSCEMIKCMLDYSTKIIVMSTESIQVAGLYTSRNLNDKIIQVNHPNYLSSYPSSLIYGREKYGIDSETLVFLFFGAVRPYKNIEVLIEAFQHHYSGVDKSCLLIAGKPNSEDYRKHLEAQVVRGNIILDLRFIPDEEITSIFSLADISVFPYGTESALNSGSLYLSFSMGTISICPEIGSVKDLKNDDICISYSYLTDEEHIEQLSKSMNSVFGLYKENREAVKSLGLQARLYMETEHSDERFFTDYSKAVI